MIFLQGARNLKLRHCAWLLFAGLPDTRSVSDDRSSPCHTSRTCLSPCDFLVIRSRKEMDAGCEEQYFSVGGLGPSCRRRSLVQL